MSLNTHALFQAPAPKSGRRADSAGDGGEKPSKETAARFQSMLEGLKKDGQATGGGKPQVGSADETPAAAVDGDGELSTSKDGGDGAGKSDQPQGGVTFATSNLADALRQMSKNVLAHSDQGKLPDGSKTHVSMVSDALADAQIVTTSIGPASQARLDTLPGQTPAVAASRSNAHSALQSAGQVADGGHLQGKNGAAENAKTGTSSLFAQFGVEPERGVDPLSRGAAGQAMLPEEAAGTVKVLRQETHFAPNMRLSPAQQVGEQIAAVLKESSTVSSQPQAGLTTKAEGPVLKTLDIQLTPHELGTVKVSLRMVGDAVEVTLLTSKAQTAELLKKDGQLLDQMLRSTGFKADTITIQAADDRISAQSGTAMTGQNGSNGNAPGENQAQAFGDGNSNRQNGRQGRSTDDNPDFAPDHQKGKGDDEDPALNLSDGIYL